MGVAECRTWKQLVLQGEQAEEIIARVRAKEKIAKQDLTNQHGVPKVILKTRKDTLATEVKSHSKTQLVRGEWLPANHMPINCTPSKMIT